MGGTWTCTIFTINAISGSNCAVAKRNRKRKEVVRLTLNEFMDKSAISMKTKGGPLLKCALEMCIEEPDIKLEAIYCILADKNKTTRNAVEKRIRVAVDNSCKEMDAEFKNKLFMGRKSRITNGDYLRTVAFVIRNNM